MLGLATARRAVREGARVAICDCDEVNGEKAARDSEPDTCDMVFATRFRRCCGTCRARRRRRHYAPRGRNTVMIDGFALSAPKYPLLHLVSTLANPVFDEATGRYQTRP